MFEVLLALGGRSKKQASPSEKRSVREAPEFQGSSEATATGLAVDERP
jgi:hypothetical protein